MECVSSTPMRTLDNLLTTGRKKNRFLWVTFQIHDICRENNDDDIRKVLKSLPRGLNATYNRILGRVIEDRKPEVAQKVFQWLAVAVRPLSLGELAEAMAFEPGCLRHAEGRFPTDNLKMLQNCGNLVTHNENDGMVQFAHYTVLEFLISPQSETSIFHLRKSEANLYVGKVCITYLSFPDFETQISSAAKGPGPPVISALDAPLSEWIPLVIRSNPNVEWIWSFLSKRLWLTQQPCTTTARNFLMSGDSKAVPLQPSEELGGKFHLLEYAAKHWLFHCSGFDSQNDESNWILFKTLVFHRTLPFVHLPWENPGSISPEFFYRPQFIWAVKNDHVALFRLIISQLITDGTPVSAYTEMKAEADHTPLRIACMSDSMLIIQVLIDLGVNVNTRSSLSGQTALQTAAADGNLVVVEVLLKNNASVNGVLFCLDGTGRTPLQAAAGGGHLAVVDRLLDSWANINSGPAKVRGRTALQAAAEGGYLNVVNRLLPFADVNAKPSTSHGLTALQAAAGAGHLAVVDRLLECGAKVNAEPAPSHGLTALQAAAGAGHLVIVNRLLGHGASVNAAPSRSCGRTALQTASAGGHLSIVNRLLEFPSCDEACSLLALHPAAENGHFRIVDRLLEYGSRVYEMPMKPSTQSSVVAALQVAAGGGHLAVVNQLLKLKAGFNINEITHGSSRTALQAAAGSGNLAVLVRLLECGANANMKAAQTKGRTVLQAAAESGCLDIVNLLLGLKIPVNEDPAEFEGRTSLQAAAGGGHLAIVDRLLKYNADVNAHPSVNGRTALQAAAEGGSLAVVNRLLEFKAKVDAEPAGKQGRTALQGAAEGGYLHVVNRLIEVGADVNEDRAEFKGLTALQAAAGGGYLDIVNRLLDCGARTNPEREVYDPDGRTALQAALNGGHYEVEDRLRRAGARY